MTWAYSRGRIPRCWNMNDFSIFTRIFWKNNSGLFAENRFAMICFKLRRQTLDPYLGLSLILHVGFMTVLVPWRGVSFVLQVKDGKPQAFEVKRLATCLPKLDVFIFCVFRKSLGLLGSWVRNMHSHSRYAARSSRVTSPHLFNVR